MTEPDRCGAQLTYSSTGYSTMGTAPWAYRCNSPAGHEGPHRSETLSWPNQSDERP